MAEFVFSDRPCERVIIVCTLTPVSPDQNEYPHCAGLRMLPARFRAPPEAEIPSSERCPGLLCLLRRPTRAERPPPSSERRQRLRCLPQSAARACFAFSGTLPGLNGPRPPQSAARACHSFFRAPPGHCHSQAPEQSQAPAQCRPPCHPHR